ncbi:MAG TPA: hypothetical protein ENH29_08825 [Bacteroidetes bacterium]|nr:hypothetical protein [Bacteroidota bacterium]
MKNLFSKDVTVLLGEADIDPQHKSLRRTPQAMKQGAYRFERGHTFYNACRQMANSLGVAFNRKLATVPGVARSNKKMAPAAGNVLFEESPDPVP